MKWNIELNEMKYIIADTRACVQMRGPEYIIGSQVSPTRFSATQYSLIYIVFGALYRRARLTAAHILKLERYRED